jgi:hypothetical protein
MSRRVSLGLVGAGLATLASRLTGEAKQRGKKRRGKKNDVNKKADQKCAAQNGQCLDLFSEQCDGDQNCLLLALQCCKFVGECDVVGFFLCQSGVSA